MEILRKSTHQMCLTATSLLGDRLAMITVLPENEPDFVERKAACSMNLSGLYEKNNLDAANNLAVKMYGKVRRLTPIECERLMGFPDNFTAGVADTNRYKCIGNSVTVPVVADIMQKILKTMV